METQIISDKLFGTIMEFKGYCERQGEEDSLQVVDDICGEVNTLLGATVGIWPTVTEMMGPEFVMTIFGAEQIVNRGLKDGMSRKRYYKDIFKDVKKKVQLFVELHGTSDVIDERISLVEDQANDI